jgi:1-acyl-sn-glycerol-3-phosphate acyltransferase
MPWYSGQALSRLLNLGGDALEDVRRLRKGWHWNSPRPRSWPEAQPAVPDRPSDLSWARMEPVRTIRYLLQRGLLMPFTEVMTHPVIEGREWVRDLERPAILVANHQSHADTPLLLHALSDRVRERTVVAAAADYWYDRPLLGNFFALWMNTFPFSRTGGAQAVLHNSSQLLKSGWNLLLYPEGSRSRDGGLQEFKPGVGHLATQTGSPVIPIHVRGTHRVMPKGARLPRPAPVRIRIGKPLQPGRQEGSKDFAARVEGAVRELAGERESPEVSGTWIERWHASRGRNSRG